MVNTITSDSVDMKITRTYAGSMFTRGTALCKGIFNKDGQEYSVYIHINEEDDKPV